MSDQTESSKLSILVYWRTIRQYKWSILAIAIISGVVGTFHALSTPSIYKAHARLWVKFSQPNLSNAQQFEAAPLYWLYFQTQADIIKSHAIAERVTDRLGLDKDSGGIDQQVRDEDTKTEDSIRTQVRAWVKDLESWLPEELRRSEPLVLDEKGRHEAVVSGVLGGVSVTGGTESEILVVSYVSSDPRKAAESANAFAEAYIDFGRESRSSNMQQATTWLAGRIDELRDKVAASEETLREYRARENLVDTENQEQIMSAKLGTWTAELIRAQTKRSEAEARFAQIKAAAERDGDYESMASAMNSVTVLEAHRAKVAQQRRVAELSERYGHKHPKMIAAQAELQEATRRLKAEVAKAVYGAREKLELAATQERRFQSLISQQQEEMRKVSGTSFELKQLEKEVEANRDLYETYLARFKEADVVDEYDAPNARIIDRAMVSMTPFQPDRQRMIMVAIFIGIGLGVLVAFVRDHLSNTFKTKEEIEEKLDLPVLGMVPRIKKDTLRDGQVERLVLARPRSPFAESINDILTAILFSHIDTPSKVVLVTSALPGEGKTTLAVNLALTFCRRGRTLLIDADLRKGRLHHIAGMEEHPGLTDALSGGCTLGEAIVPDAEIEHLFLLMPGTVPPNPLEIVSSNRFSELLAKLRDQFDYIVIDATPLLPVSDSIVLSRLADATVLTVKADDTTCDAVQDSVRRLQSTNVKPVGVVMQQVDMQKVRRYGHRYTATYSGYYGYHAHGPKS